MALTGYSTGAPGMVGYAARSDGPVDPMNAQNAVPTETLEDNLQAALLQLNQVNSMLDNLEGNAQGPSEDAASMGVLWLGEAVRQRSVDLARRIHGVTMRLGARL